MQAAIYYPAIRHLVVALGSAYEHFEGRQMDPSQMEFAVQQSNQSIRLLTQSPFAGLTKQSVESSSTLVTASLLFTILSSMQGQMGDAMDHIRSGLRVLQSMEYEQQSSEDGSSTDPNRSVSPSPAYPVPIARLRSLLTSLYLQCRVMVNNEDESAWRKDPLINEIDFPNSFTSLNDARDHVESLFGNQITFFEQTALRYPLTDEEVIAAQAHQGSLVYSLDCSRQALDTFVARRPLSSSAKDNASIKVLRLYHLYLGIRMGVGVLQEDTRELAFDEFEPQFEQMLFLCRDLVNTGETLRPTCSSGLGVVIPLHMVGHRCRNQAIRTEAVELLLKASRREGLWDSSVVGRIAATTSSLEQDEDVIQQWRVREVKTQFMSDRRARLVFIAGDTGSSNQRRYYRGIDW